MSRFIAIAQGVLFGLILIAAPASAQILNPGFESNSSGSPQDWTFTANGGSSFISFFDSSMPTEGSRFAVLSGGTNGPATPHSNPGGFGSEASGTVSLSQTFNFPTAQNSMIEFDAILLGNDMVNADFLEVSISTSGFTRNILHLDTMNDVGNPGAATTFTGLMASSVVHVTADVGSLFFGTNQNNDFTITIHLGNVGDNQVPPRAHIDNFTLTPGTPFPPLNSVAFIPGTGSVRLEITTELPFTEYFTVISHDTSGPKGFGTFGGIYLDIQTLGIISLPPGNPGLHDFTDGTAAFGADVFIGVAPVGLVFDYMLAALSPTGIQLTEVKRGTWGISEDN